MCLWLDWRKPKIAEHDVNLMLHILGHVCCVAYESPHRIGLLGVALLFCIIANRVKLLQRRFEAFELWGPAAKSLSSAILVYPLKHVKPSEYESSHEARIGHEDSPFGESS